MIEVIQEWWNNPIDDVTWHGLKAFQIKRIVELFQFLSGWVILVDILGENWFNNKGKAMDRFIVRLLWPIPSEQPTLLGFGIVDVMAKIWVHMQFAMMKFTSRKGDIRAGYTYAKSYLTTKSYIKSNPQLMLPYLMMLYFYLFIIFHIGFDGLLKICISGFLLLLMPVLVPTLVLIAGAIVVLGFNLIFFASIKLPAWFLMHEKFRQRVLTISFLVFVASSFFAIVFA